MVIRTKKEKNQKAVEEKLPPLPDLNENPRYIVDPNGNEKYPKCITCKHSTRAMTPDYICARPIENVVQENPFKLNRICHDERYGKKIEYTEIPICGLGARFYEAR